MRFEVGDRVRLVNLPDDDSITDPNTWPWWNGNVGVVVRHLQDGAYGYAGTQVGSIKGEAYGIRFDSYNYGPDQNNYHTTHESILEAEGPDEDEIEAAIRSIKGEA